MRRRELLLAGMVWTLSGSAWTMEVALPGTSAIVVEGLVENKVGRNSTVEEVSSDVKAGPEFNENCAPAKNKHRGDAIRQNALLEQKGMDGESSGPLTVHPKKPVIHAEPVSVCAAKSTAQEEFLVACSKQDLSKMKYLVENRGSEIDVNEPLSDRIDKYNCLLFLTDAGNLDGVSLLLKNGANPYYQSNGESALTIALKYKGTFKPSTTNAYSLSWRIVPYVNYNEMPEVIKYLSSLREELLPVRVVEFPIHLKDVLISRPKLLLSTIKDEFVDPKVTAEMESIRADEPKKYREARKVFSDFYFNDDALKFRLEARFVPLGKICNTHAVSSASTIDKLKSRREALRTMKDQIKYEGAQAMISFSDYQRVVPSTGPIVVYSYGKGMSAVMDGNSRIVSLNRVYDRTTLIEVLFVEILDETQQNTFNGIVDDLLKTANFHGFDEIYCR